MKTGILIIDVQNVMFLKDYAVHNDVAVLKKVKLIEQTAIDKNIPLIYIQHDGGPGSWEEKGTPNWQLHPELQVKGPVVEKTTLSAFESSNLDEVLKEKGITDIVVCGMQSDHCINANSRGAKALGYGVTVIGDAHSTTKSETQTAEQIIDEINKKLSEVVTVTRLEQWLGSTKS